MITSFTGKYRFLSNFWPAPVFFHGEWYSTVEHAYQAAKSTNPNVRQEIRLADTPGKAKKMGKSVILRPDWEEFKLQLMENLVDQKFIETTLRSKLILTMDEELVEGNTCGDKFWGMVQENGVWVGENHLGKILMKVRENCHMS